jgi:hypothetical protein
MAGENKPLGGFDMPKWLKNQIQLAFLQKDRNQIKLLNQCWFYYTEKRLKQIVKPLRSI